MSRKTRARTDEPTDQTTITAAELPPEQEPELPIHQDPPPAPMGEEADPPPESMPEAPQAPDEVESSAQTTPKLSPEDLAVMCGALFGELNEVVIARAFPTEPLTPTEKQKLADGCGPLIAYYMPKDISPVMLLWVGALGTMTAVYLPRIKNRREAEQRKRDLHGLHGSRKEGERQDDQAPRDGEEVVV